MILSWMIYASAVTLLLALAALAAEGVVRQRNRPVRGLWVGAIAGALTLPFLLRSVASDAELVTPPSFVGAGAQPEGNIEPLIQAPIELQEEGIPGPDGPSKLHIDLDVLLLRVWAIASSLLALGLLLSSGQLARRRRRWRPAEVEGRTVLIASDTGPAVAGILRGAVVLPDWLMSAPAGDRLLALQHEDEHVRAKDPALLFASLFLSILVPWNAPLWWVGTRLRRAVEIDCDLRVIARGADPRAYSKFLVEVMNHGSAHRLIVGALSETPSFLERRIRHMLEKGTTDWWMRASRAAVVVAVCFVAACRLDQPQDALTPAVIITDAEQAIPSTLSTSDSTEAASPTNAQNAIGEPLATEVGTTMAAATSTDPITVTGTTIELFSQRRLNVENFMEFLRVVVPDLMEEGAPTGQAVWLAVDNSGVIRKRWIGPDLFINVQDSIDPRSPSRAPGSAEERQAKEAHHLAVERVLRANLPEMSMRSAATIFYGKRPGFVLTIVSEAAAAGDARLWADRRPIDLVIRTSEPVTSTQMARPDAQSVTWRGEQWMSMQERVIRPDFLQRVGEVNGDVVYSEAGAEDPRVIFRLVRAPDVFMPFMRE